MMVTANPYLVFSYVPDTAHLIGHITFKKNPVGLALLKRLITARSGKDGHLTPESVCLKQNASLPPS